MERTAAEKDFLSPINVQKSLIPKHKMHSAQHSHSCVLLTQIKKSTGLGHRCRHRYDRNCLRRNTCTCIIKFKTIVSNTYPKFNDDNWKGYVISTLAKSSFSFNVLYVAFSNWSSQTELSRAQTAAYFFSFSFPFLLIVFWHSIPFMCPNCWQKFVLLLLCSYSSVIHI